MIYMYNINKYFQNVLNIFKMLCVISLILVRETAVVLFITTLSIEIVKNIIPTAL